MTVLQAAAAVCVLAIACIPPSVRAMEPSGEHLPELVSAGQFPAAGHSYHVDFGRSKFRLAFISDKEMTFTSLVDPTITETVKIAVTQLRSNLFMVAWTERPETGSFTSKTLNTWSSTPTSSGKTGPLCA